MKQEELDSFLDAISKYTLEPRNQAKQAWHELRKATKERDHYKQALEKISIDPSSDGYMQNSDCSIGELARKALAQWDKE